MFYDIEQNTDEWFALRLGVPTASNFSKLMASVIKGDKVNVNCAFGDPAKKYARKIALEIVKGERIPEDFHNHHMDRGHEEEPIARQLYMDTTFNEVTNGGIWVDDNSGASSDGLIGKEGMIEIKSVIYDVQCDRVERGGFETAYKWQIQGNLWKYDRLWCDFVQYCSVFPEGGQLYVFRVKRDDTMIELLKQRVVLFNILVQEKVKQYKDFINGK